MKRESGYITRLSLCPIAKDAAVDGAMGVLSAIFFIDKRTDCGMTNFLPPPRA